MTYQRYVALGDSFTEGVGDPDPTRPNGLRGWADQVAEVLAAGEPGFGHANLAIRGRKLDAVIAEQLEPALAMAPDLVTVYAGANDILRPAVDLDALVGRYEAAIARLVGSGARVLVWTAFDPGGSAVYRPVRGRFAIYNELVREAVERTGADLVDFWRLRDYRDWRMWDTDRMHMGPAGHRRMAVEVLDVLGVPHDLTALGLPEQRSATRAEAARADLAWARSFALPWVHRRLTGRSSGDAVSARRPDLGPVEQHRPVASSATREGHLRT